MRNFLSICGPLEFDGATARGTLDFSRYADWQTSHPAFLLTEGINQFCVRVGRMVMATPNAPPPRILPVAIKRLEVEPRHTGTSFSIEGVGVAFGNTTRVTVTVSSLQDEPGGEAPTILANGDVIVAALPSGGPRHAA